METYLIIGYIPLFVLFLLAKLLIIQHCLLHYKPENYRNLLSQKLLNNVTAYVNTKLRIVKNN